jgi:predicted transcriptional regulator of viral defense system
MEKEAQEAPRMAQLDLAERLYFTMEREGDVVIRTKEAAEQLGVSLPQASWVLRRMVAKGYLERVRHGLYARLPPEVAAAARKYRADPITLAAGLVSPYFLSHYTALTLHGAAARVVGTYFVTTPKRPAPFEYRGYRFKFVWASKQRFFGFERREYGETEVTVSDRERTLLDVMDRPGYGGGWAEILECLRDYGEVDWERVLDYLERLGKKVVGRRLGYVMQEVLGVEMPEGVLERLRKRWVDRATLRFGGGRGGGYVKKWGLVVDEQVFKESLV